MIASRVKATRDATFELLNAAGRTVNRTLGIASLGMDNYCVRKYPGTPSNNGAITQDVYLVAGNVYDFSANIASKYCST